MQYNKHQGWFDSKDIQSKIYMWIHIPEELRDLSSLTNSK